MVTTTRTTYVAPAKAGLARRLAAGALGGLAGGIVFGVLMAMMGMLAMIASMLGSDSVIVGLAVHLMMSIMIGLALTVTVGPLLLTSVPRGLLIGLAYGALWWVMGPLVAMPLMLGMPMFALDATALLALMGHLIYGAILGIVATLMLRVRDA
jgi:uncharacterized membrane protein YagU involved in acid resistance